MALVGEVIDELIHRGAVVHPHPGETGGVLSTGEDAWQPELVQQGRTRVVGAWVGDDHPVDTPLGPPLPVGVHLLLDAADELEHEVARACGEHPLDAGDELHEEPLAGEGLLGASDHEPDGPRLPDRQGDRGDVGRPAELRRDALHPAPGFLGDAGPIVERE